MIAEVTALGGTGGVIVAAPDGEMAWSFNTAGMYRGRVVATGEPDGRDLRRRKPA